MTSPARTAIDLALGDSFESALISIDHVLHTGLASAARLATELDIAAGRRQWKAARDVVVRASPLAESPAESLTRARYYQLGAPEPILQRKFFDANGLVGRVDGYFTDADCIVECDGKMKYMARALPNEDPGEVVYREKLREDRLRALVRFFLRTSWNDALQVTPLEVKLRRVGVLGGAPVRMFGLR